MHAIRPFRLSQPAGARNLAALDKPPETVMNPNTPLQFGLLDDLLFSVALFAPVSLLLSGSMALAAIA
jgi:hypothetical protein